MSCRLTRRVRSSKPPATIHDAALALEPQLRAVALDDRGVVRLQLGDVPGAIGDLDAALERNPTYEAPA